jgi:L-alanine-DL-glutamate epimerase-like enolase superfamily enzyme
VINLKITRVGGLSKARQIRDLCTSLGIGLWIQETGGSQIANAGTAHLGHSTRKETALGVWDCTELAHITVADHGPELGDGRMRAPDRPGLGIEPKLDVLGEPTMTFG